MTLQKINRWLSFALALLLAVSLMPVSALGAEAEETTTDETAATQVTEATAPETETTEETQAPAEPEISDAALALQARIDALLGLYGIEDTMTDEEISTAIILAEGDTIHKTMTEREAIETDAMALTMDELLTLDLDLYERFWHFFDPIFYPIPAITVTGISGVEVTVDGNGSISESGGTVTVTAKGSFTSRKTATITVKNTSGSTATVSFDYSASKYSKDNSTIYELAGADSGSCSVLLTAGATKTFTLASNTWTTSTTATAKLSNFKVVAAAAESNVTVTYTNLGSVKMDGNAVASGSVNPVSSSTGATFVATPTSGAKFIAWINPDNGALISESATYQLIPTEDTKIKAVFTNAASSPWFWCNGKSILLEGMAAALAHVANASNKVFTLASDGTLPSGNYTIPAGVTLLIPYDAAGTLCTAKPSEHKNAYTAPSVFRTLTIANGANITVNGAISISGSISSKYGNNGMPSGPYGKINMNSGSKITVNDSAKLYAWGYITGAGSVEINNGGHVYECFQVADYRGGDATTQIVGKDDEYGVFPFNQYYVQNVEVPMTLHAGATETGYGAVYVTMAGHQPMSIPFIGNVENQSMFVISSGYIIKDYMEGTGRTKMGIYGDLKVTKVNVDIKVSLIGDISIDSSKYALPIPQHFNISLESGSVTMNQNVAFFPGSELYIREGTTCTLGSGKKIYVYDLDQWLYNEGKNGYSGTTNLPYMQLKHVPGGDGTTGRLKDALIQIDGTVDASAGSVYVTSGGANIYSTGTGKVVVGSAPDTTVRQVITNDTDVGSWPEIPIVPAILQNAAGKDPASTNTAETTGTYVYRNGIWCTHTDTVYTDSDKNHKCDTCGTVMSACSDVTGDGNHSCDICGTENVSSHTGGAAATCTTAQICTECGATVTPAMGHKWSGTKCSACGIIKLYATNIRAGDFLNMFFYVRAADLDLSEGKNYYAHIEKTYADKRPNVTKDIYYRNADGSQNWETYETDYLRFRFDDISAKEMTDEIHVTIFDSDGKQISTVTTETLRDYAMRLLKTLTSDDLSAKNKKLRTTLIDMLNYGAAAQDFFGDYGINDLANAGCEAYQGWVTGDDVSCEKGTTDKTQGLDSAIVIADNGLTLRLYFNNLSDTTGLTATISYQNHHGNKVERTTTEFDTTTASPLVGVGITGLAIADGRQLVTCTITNGEDTTVASGTYSVERYLAMHKADDAVYLKLMKFIDSAYNYFHS